MSPSTSSPLALPAALGHESTDKRIAILREVAVSGSISQAARVVGVSYKAAWQAIDTLTNLAGAPLVARAVGGAGGGGAALTESGHELLAAADAMEQARSAVLARWQETAHAGVALGRLSVRTSMRNQLPCVVQRLDLQGQVVRVHLALDAPDAGHARASSSPGNLRDLTARITRESAELLGLAEGLRLQALCKATAVRVLRRGTGGAQSPSSCLLEAKAVRIARGALGDEVVAQLWGRTGLGLQMVGFAAPESGLRVGNRVLLALEENAVVLAQA